MTKCDFCKKSGPNGNCSWNSQFAREDDCEKAIKLMIETFKNIGGKLK